MPRTIGQIVAEVVDDWRAERPSPDDLALWLREAVLDTTPARINPLFRLVVEDISLAFIETSRTSETPFGCLRAAVVEEVERRVRVAIEAEASPGIPGSAKN